MQSEPGHAPQAMEPLELAPDELVHVQGGATAVVTEQAGDDTRAAAAARKVHTGGVNVAFSDGSVR